MEKIQVEAWLGKTRYVLTEQSDPLNVKVTRYNEGETDFWFAKDLITKYVVKKVQIHLGRLVTNFLKNAIES